MDITGGCHAAIQIRLQRRGVHERAIVLQLDCFDPATQDVQPHDAVDHVLRWHVRVGDALTVVEQHLRHLNRDVAHVGQRHLAIAIGRDDGSHLRLQRLGHVVDLDTGDMHTRFVVRRGASRCRSVALQFLLFGAVWLGRRAQYRIVSQERAARRQSDGS